MPDVDQNKDSNLAPVLKDMISNADSSKAKDSANKMEVDSKEKIAMTTDTTPSKETAIIKDQKSGVAQKPGIDQEPTGNPADSKSELKSVLENPEQLQAKSSAPEQEISKQESGFFEIGFGSTKSSTGKLFGFGGLAEAPPTQSASSVSGKVLGFGSSIFSSASNLISSAVHDEHSKTPPSSRKGSTVSQTSIKTVTPPSSRKGSTVSQASLKTPPTSRKGSAASQHCFKNSPIVDMKSSDSEKQDEQAAEKKSKLKVDAASSEPVEQPDSQHIEKTADKKLDIKASGNLQSDSKQEPASCPICKVKLNMASEDPPNFKTCTECYNNVCNQCGFDPMPNQKKVRE